VVTLVGKSYSTLAAWFRLEFEQSDCYSWCSSNARQW
jgi:hypothetical protein